MEVIITIAIIFAVWRITHMLHKEAGPGEIFTKLRSTMFDDDGHPTNFWGTLFICFLCLSVWVGAVAALIVVLKMNLGLLDSVLAYLLFTLAFSAGAILFNSVFDKLSE